MPEPESSGGMPSMTMAKAQPRQTVSHSMMLLNSYVLAVTTSRAFSRISELTVIS